MQTSDEINLNKLIEEICRKICKDQSIDPDVMVCKHMPQFIAPGYQAGFFIPSKDFMLPMWMIYRDVAMAAYEVLADKF